MKEELSRTKIIVGEEGLNKLQNATVAVFGVGGVGGFVVEALARAGVGHIVLCDNDVVSRSNINRQIIALQNTIGLPKVEVMKDRIYSINPDIIVDTHQCFYLPETADQFDFSNYDYVVDAIDTVTGKIQLVLQAQSVNTPIISSMGTGNKLDPTLFEVSDIYKTSVCPLAKVMRRELKKRGVKKLKVVYSKEIPNAPYPSDEMPSEGRRAVPGSISFVPSVAGLIIAGEVIKDLMK